MYMYVQYECQIWGTSLISTERVTYFILILDQNFIGNQSKGLKFEKLMFSGGNIDFWDISAKMLIFRKKFKFNYLVISGGLVENKLFMCLDSYCTTFI